MAPVLAPPAADGQAREARTETGARQRKFSELTRQKSFSLLFLLRFLVGGLLLCFFRERNACFCACRHHFRLEEACLSLRKRQDRSMQPAVRVVVRDSECIDLRSEQAQESPRSIWRKHAECPQRSADSPLAIRAGQDILNRSDGHIAFCG